MGSDSLNQLSRRFIHNWILREEEKGQGAGENPINKINLFALKPFLLLE